jgi:hypothetical protein
MTPNDDTRDEELLARYRRASADAAGPSEAVRAAILAESRRVAEGFAKQAPPPTFDVSRPAANDSRWKIPAFGTIGAALLAALIFAPRYWEKAPPAQNTVPSEPALVATQAQDKAEQPKSEEMESYAAPSNAASARQSPGGATPREGVVAQADRKSSRSAGVPSLNPPVPAPAAPTSAAENYAPGSASSSSLVAAPSAPAARVTHLDLSARAVASAALPAPAGVSADSALKPATLQSAAAQGDVAQAAALLDQGAVIDARDEAGRTPLLLAVTQGRVEIVRLLLARGADPNAVDNTGHTPLQLAKMRNLQDVAALLQEAGAH